MKIDYREAKARREEVERFVEAQKLYGEILEDLIVAAFAIERFHTQAFCRGRPLTIDGVSIDHTDLNIAAGNAARALRKLRGEKP